MKVQHIITSFTGKVLINGVEGGTFSHVVPPECVESQKEAQGEFSSDLQTSVISTFLKANSLAEKRTQPKRQVQKGTEKALKLNFTPRNKRETKVFERDQAILNMKHDGFKHREIVEKLKVSKATIYCALQRAKKRGMKPTSDGTRAVNVL